MPKYDIQNQELYHKIPKTTDPAILSQIPQWIYGYCTDLNHEVCVWWNKNWQKRINFEADLGLSNIVPCPAIMQLIVLYNNLFFKFARLHNHHCCRPTYNFNLLITIIDLQQRSFGVRGEFFVFGFQAMELFSAFCSDIPPDIQPSLLSAHSTMSKLKRKVLSKVY